MTRCGKFEQCGCGVGECTAAFPDQATSVAGGVGEQPHWAAPSRHAHSPASVSWIPVGELSTLQSRYTS